MPDQLSRDRVKDRDREQRKTNHQQAGHRPAVERDAQRRRAGLTGGLRRAHICDHGDTHANETGRKGAERADYKPNRRRMIFENEEENENDNRDCADRDDLPVQVCFRAFLHRRRNLLHALIAGRLSNDRRDQEKCEGQSDGRAQHRQVHAGIEKRESEKHRDHCAIKRRTL